MQKVKFIIEINAEQLSAINLYTNETLPDLKSVISDTIQRHYNSIVPQEVRHFLESKANLDRSKPGPNIPNFKTTKQNKQKTTP